MPLRASTSDKILLWYLRLIAPLEVTIQDLANGLVALERESGHSIYGHPRPEVCYQFNRDLSELDYFSFIEIQDNTVRLTAFGNHVASLFEPEVNIVEAQKRLVERTSSSQPTPS